MRAGVILFLTLYFGKAKLVTYVLLKMYTDLEEVIGFPNLSKAHNQSILKTLVVVLKHRIRFEDDRMYNLMFSTVQRMTIGLEDFYF